MLLDIQDLHVRFRNAPPGKEAVKGISLDMREGEILGLVGESGSGKTVTAMALAGLLSNAKTELSGQIFFRGMDLLQASRETVRALRGREIAVVFQEPMTCHGPGDAHRPPGGGGPDGPHQAWARPSGGRRPCRPWPTRNCRSRRCSMASTPTSCPAGCSSGPWWPRPSSRSPNSSSADEPTTALDVTIQAQHPGRC